MPFRPELSIVTQCRAGDKVQFDDFGSGIPQQPGFCFHAVWKMLQKPYFWRFNPEQKLQYHYHCDYWPELLHKYTPSRQLRSSFDSFTLRVPTTNRKTFRESSFSFTGPAVWNSLPFDIHSINSTPSFRQARKTHLFKSYFVSN